jgi:hypothetical protein
MKQRCLICTSIFLVLLAWAPKVAAQEDPLRDLGDPVARVQALYVGLADESRAELVLLPALAEFEAAPEAASEWVVPGDEGWGDVAAWLDAASQQKVFEAVEAVGVDDTTFVFGLGYGRASAPEALAENPLVPMLMNGEFLAGMHLDYLGVMSRVSAAVRFEALRRASDGDGGGALELQASMIRTWRLIADRPMYAEVDAAFGEVLTILESMRDVLYLYPESVSAEELKGLIKELDDRALRIDRVRFPMGDKLAYQQLVRESFFKFGSPDPSRFGPLMAQLASGEKQLQMFGESSWWVRAIDEHGDYYRTSDAIDAVFGDWEFRWGLDPEDDLLGSDSDYERLDPAANAMLLLQLRNEEDLLSLRDLIGLELAGTRLSMGCVGYKQEIGEYPKPLPAIRPGFVREISFDPYGADLSDRFLYFVPMRDQQRGAREKATPHAMNVFSSGSIGDQRGQILAMIQLPNIKSYLSVIPPEVYEVVQTDITDLSDTNIGAAAGTPMVLSKASTLYKFLTTPGAFLAMQARLTPEEAAEINDKIVKVLQEDNTFGVLAKTIQATRSLPRSNYVELIDRYVSMYAFEVHLKQNAKRLGSMFSLLLGGDTFVLYSVGLNSKDEYARDVGIYGTDYLIWPPVMSLVREHREELSGE